MVDLEKRAIDGLVDGARSLGAVGVFLDSVSDAVVIIDPDGQVVLVNAETERLFGFSRSELVGLPVAQLVPERFREAHARYRADYRSDPRSRAMGAGLEIYGRRKDGTEFPIDISLSPLGTEAGVLFAATIRDITEGELRQPFSAFLEWAPDAVVVVDSNGRMVGVNARTEQLFGFSRAELLGQRVEQLVPERFREAHVAHRARYRSEPRFRPLGAGLELYGRRKDGTEFPVDISLSRVESGEGIFFAAAIRDVTERWPAGAVARPGPVLLATKFRLPPVPAKVVSRPRLAELLDEAATRKVTLVSAPVGSGKTTLLKTWSGAAHQDRPVAWVSLDDGDNDPVQFWAYVIESLRAIAPAMGARLLSVLRAPGTGIAEAVLPPLLNEVAGLPRPATLVLDDYHVISNREIHDQVELLVAHLPDTLHLVVATRTDPPWPLARLRARGELCEVREVDLRFTEAEAAQLLSETLGLGLSASQVARLHQRTEGWAAGLYLAGLLLRGQSDPQTFMEAFAGDDWHLVDYLRAEVLDRQPQDVRRFLLHTSILDRLTASLCDAVTEGDGSDRMLEELERSNQFLIPLDSRHECYRYHQLFGELLRYELGRADPELVAVLHRRASAWHEQAGLIPRAVQHALAAGDVAGVSQLLARHWRSFVNDGQVATVAGWLDALPEAVVTADAHLCVARAGIAVFLAQPEEAWRWLALAESIGRAGPPRREASAVESEVAALRAIEFRMAGDLRQAAEEGRRAIALEPKTSPSPWGALSHVVLGGSLYWLGETAEARAVLEEVVRSGQFEIRHFSVIWALGHLAVISCDEDDLHRADELARRSLALADEHGFAEHYATAMAHIALGRILERRGELGGAEASLLRGLELSRQFRAPAQMAYSLLAIARIRGAKGDHEGARPYLREARSIIRRCPDLGIIDGFRAEVEREPNRVSPRPLPRAELVGKLTDRERSILRLLGSDLTQRQIASEIYVSFNTMKTHTRSLYRKLGASSRREAVDRASELGLL